MPDIQRILWGIWWTRGITAAMAILGLLAPVLGLERYEFLRATHALMVGWNDVMAWIGSWILFPFDIDVDPFIINAVIVAATIHVPSSIFVLQRFRGVRRSIVAVGFFVVLLFLASSIILAVYSGADLSEFVRDYAGRSRVFRAVLAFAFLSIITTMILGIRLNQSYRQGVALVFGAILTWQALYYAPIVGDQVKVWTDQILAPASAAGT